MKIICLIDNLGSGGAQRQMVTLASLWQKRGFDIEFIVYSKNDFFKSKLDLINIPINAVYANNNLQRIIEVGKLLFKKKPDIVVSFLSTPNFIATVIKCFCNCTWKLITSERSAMESELTSRRGQLFAWFQRYSDAIVCNSENAKKLWVKHYPKYFHKLHVIYNPVIINCDDKKYAPRVNGKTSFVIAASYQQLKNPIGLVEGVNLLTQAEKDSIVINWYGVKNVSGTGTTIYNEAVSLINKYNLQKTVILNEETTKISDIMCEADVIGLFSSVEGLPNAICEGMTLGKPIIMTRVSDYEQIVDKSNGILCNWNDYQSISKSIRNMMNKTNDELIEMGNVSRQKANVLFSKDVIINKWLKEFRYK